MNRVIVVVFFYSVLLLTFGAFSYEMYATAPANIYVPDDYSTIQVAVDAANPGDTIIVREGTYTENVKVNIDHLTIKSENGAEVTIVQATTFDGPVFNVIADFVEISDLTVKGKHEDFTTGIKLSGAQYCTLRNNRMVKNSLAISLVDSSFCLILNNDIPDAPYRAINLRNSVCNKVSNNNGGLIYCSSSNGNIIEDNNMHIILHFTSSYNVIRRNTLSRNNSYMYSVADSSSNQNKFYLNNFIGYFRSHGNNTWNSPKTATYSYQGNAFQGYLGNYWLKNAGLDVDGNGVCDSPYDMIEIDSYPLVVNTESYLVERPTDIIPPETQITNGPNTTIDYNNATISWIGSDDTSSPSDLVYSYYLEGYDFRWRCTVDTIVKYEDLRNGAYILKVKAMDESGNIDPTPAEISFKVSTKGQIETIDTKGNVGWHSSLAFDIWGNPGISYSDTTEGHVKFAYWNGSSWDIKFETTVSYYGTSTSLAFDNSGNPAISYWGDKHLKYVYWDGTNWNIETVDNDRDVGLYSSLAFDNTGNPAISYWGDSSELRYAHFDGTSWQIEIVDEGYQTGKYTSLAFDNSGNPAISYLSSVELRYAHFNGTSWNIETPESGDIIVYFSSLAFDNSGNPAIAYCVYSGFNYRFGEIKYALWNDTSWDLHTVEDLGKHSDGTPTSGNVYPSLAFDGSGWPAVSYYDRVNKVLKYARYTGQAWSINMVDSNGDIGQFSSLCFDQLGNPAISYYDKTNGYLKFIWTTVDNHPPKRPINIRPLDGRACVSLPVNLESSSFSDPDLDTHVASQWQISVTLGNYLNPIFDSGRDMENLTSITIPEGILTYDTTYYWHVRHQDDEGAWSEWSKDISFNSKFKLYVPDDYLTIQAAVDAISPGNTIMVRDGTYIENVRIYKSLTLRSENGPDTTIIQAANPDKNVISILHKTTEEGSTQGDNVSLSGFTVIGGATGIRLYNVFYCTISNNNVNSNKNAGITLGSPGYNVVTENDLSNNERYGIKLDSAYRNTITKNRISSNGQYGIYLISYGYFPPSINNHIYLNNFMNNTINIGGYPARNFWSSTEKMDYKYEGKTFTNYLGNFRDNYTGSDADGNGIGDAPYTGDDNYPLMKPFQNYGIARYWVQTTANLNVREGPGLSYTIINTMPLGTTGQILGGLEEADGFIWWDVEYAVGVRGWSAENWLELYPVLDQPPTSVVKLQKDGVEIDEVGVGEFFDVYAGDSTGDKDIKQVRFSSDNVQDGYPTGKWTEWIDWDVSSEDWDAATKNKRWAFATPGYKEVWAEVKDETDQNAFGLATIFVPFPSLPVITSPLVITPEKDIYHVGDSLEAEFTIKNIGVLPITLDAITVGGRLNGFIPPEGAPDFTFRSVTLQPNEAYQYEGVITVTQSGNYRFFVAYNIENPTVEEKSLLDENNWNTFVQLGEGLTNNDRVKNINVFEEDSVPEEVSQLRETINRWKNIHLDYQYPAYLRDTDSLTSAVATIWASFTSLITRTELTKKYDELYFTGVDYQCLSFQALMDADLSLESGNVEDAGRYLQRSIRYNLLSAASFTAATEVFDNNLEAGEILAQRIQDNCETVVSVGVKIVYPPAAPWVDGIIMGIDYAVTEKVQGIDQANKDFFVKVLTKWLLKDLKFTSLNDNNLETYINRVREKVSLDKLLVDELFMSEFGLELYNVINDQAIEVLGSELSTEVTEEIVKDVVDHLESLINSVKAKVKCPVELRVIDLQGQTSGLVNNTVKHDLSMSLYNNGTVTMFNPDDSYQYEVAGMNEGNYSLEITSLNGGNTTTFNAIDIPTSANEIHRYMVDWGALSLGEEGVTVKIDSDGDGKFEYTFTADNELTHARYESLVSSYLKCSLFLQSGWNIISLSVLPDDPMASSVLSDVGVYRLITWSGTGYVTASEFEAGHGYWLLVIEDTNVTISGDPVDWLNLTLSPGWSMIGGLNSNVQAADVFPEFYQLVTSTGTGYTPATVFEPGKGYWALVLAETKIQLPPT